MADSPARHVALVSAGASHSIAILSDKVVCSWGRGEDGQLGHGDAEDRLLPTLLSTLDGLEILSITCGADHTTAYSESKLQVYSWGWGDFGRLGHGNSSDVFTPQPIKALQGIRIKQIACGDSHCLAVTTEGGVQSWGRNQNGQLGLGTAEDSLVPHKIQAFQGISVKMVAAGAEHSAAVTEDGDLYGWGWGRYGNLGLGDRNDRLVPEKVSANDGQRMVLVACGWRHTITVSLSGTLYTYGWSKYGQLGHGDFEDHLIPHKLEALKDSSIFQISGGWRHTMALTSDGMLYGWGWNKFGQVGVGDYVDHCSPVQVNFPQNQKIVHMSSGWRHTLAVTERKNVFSWGRGTNGQLGHGDTLDRFPAMVGRSLNCKMFDEHLYWDHLEETRFCFLKVMEGEFSQSMEFSEKFARNFRVELPENIALEGPNGKLWEAKLHKEANHLYLRDGWKEFVDAYDVKEGYTLIFKYARSSSFTVQIFDQSGLSSGES